MFLFLTTPGHDYTVEELVRPLPDADVPPCKATTYDAVLQSTHSVRAVHVFTDLERLSDSQLATAAHLYRTLSQLGIPCLNNPARVMGRYQLLCNLFKQGINPFAAYRADERPKPSQFPVFVRNESDHEGPLSALLHDQSELDRYLQHLTDIGRPLRGLLVIEYAAEPLMDGVWRKTGTYRIGKHHVVHHQILSDNWVIKQYTRSVTSDALQREEQDAIIANDVPASVRCAFDVAGVDWGRADHLRFRGQDIIFEINTNPTVMVSDRHGYPIRAESKRIAFTRICAHLREMDWGDGTKIRYRGKPFWRRLKESQRIRNVFRRAVSP